MKYYKYTRKIIYEFRLLGNNVSHDYDATYNKVLIAGGGIGDSTLFLAEQLNHTNAEVSKPSYCIIFFLLSILISPSTGHLLIFKLQIVYLDFSPTSLATAQARAEARNLKNIRWVVKNRHPHSHS